MHRAANAYCAIYLVLLYYHRHRGICTVGAIDCLSSHYLGAWPAWSSHGNVHIREKAVYIKLYYNLKYMCG